MTHCFVTYTFKDKEKRDGFYAELTGEGLDEKCRADKGCVQYKYFYPIGEENTIFLWEKWESREALEGHLQQPHMPQIRALKEKYAAESELKIQDMAE